MISLDVARGLALSLQGAEEYDHFGSPSFRVGGKIFAQLSKDGAEDERALVKLTPADQSALILSTPDVFSAVPQWGRHGWTHIRLADVEESVLRDLFMQSWRLVVSKKKLTVAPGGAKAKKSRRGGRVV